jgi:aldehyde dehydrogenase (NAD+)
VLCLIPCEDEEDAIRIANQSPYGLNGSVLTNRCGRGLADRAPDPLWRGGGRTVCAWISACPYGGFKQSGIGREGGPEGLLGLLSKPRPVLLDAMPAQL